jgi:hypothetical protein
MSSRTLQASKYHRTEFFRLLHSFPSHDPPHDPSYVQESSRIRHKHLPFPLSQFPQLPVPPPKQPLQKQRATNRHATPSHHRQHGHNIPRLMALRKGEWRDQVANESHDIDHSSARSPLLRRAAQSRNRPRDDQRVRRGAAADVQERRRVARCWAEAGDGDDVADDGDDHGACDVLATFFQAVAVPGYGHGCEGCHEVWRGCEEGRHGRVAHVEGAHDCWAEVIEAEGAGDADVEGDLWCLSVLAETKADLLWRTLTNPQVLISVRASPRPYHTEWLASGSDTRSAARRAAAAFLRSSESQYTPAPVFDPGKSGMKNGPMRAKKAPVAGSMMNSHCHPANPIVPCKLLNTPAAINPEEAMAMQRAT